MALKTHREYIKELEKEQEKNKNKKKTLKTHQEYIKEIGFVYDPKLSSKNRRISEIKKENQEKNTWFNKNAQGTTGQKIAATTGDITLNLIKGVIDAGDFIGDLGSYGVAGVADLLGFDDYAKDVREGAQIRLSNALLKPIDDNIDKYSVLGEKSDSVFSSVGQSYAGGKVGQAFLPNAGNIPIGKLNMPVTAVATGASSSITEAYKNGANNKQALVKGITGGLIEGFSEGIFGVFGQGGSELEDMVTRTLTKKIENQVMRKIAKTGVSALGEGLEEQISYTLNWIADNGQDVVFEALGMTPENKMGKEWNWQEFGESGLSGALAGGLGAGATNIGMNATQNQIEQAIHDTQNNLGRTLTRQEQGIVSNNVASGNQIDSKKLADAIKTDEEVVKALVKERQKESKGKSYQEIRKEVIKDLEQGDIDINKINEIIGGKDYQTYQQYGQEINELANRRKEIKEEILDKAKKDSIEYKNAKVEYDALQEQINNYDAKTLKGNLQNLINDKVLQNGLISNSYRENAKRSVKYEADLSKYNDKEKAIVQKAIDSGVLNNTRRTHILVDMVAKLASDKGVDFDFTNNKNLEDSGFAIKDKVIDGYVTGNNIALNVESPKALNKIVGHEITHVLEGTELYDQLKTAIEKYAELKGEYQSRLEETTKRYKNVEDADVKKEVVADLVGDYIFNDPKFVQQLSTEQPSLFKKIFNEIKYLCKVVTAGSQEAKQLEKVKKIFEDVYRENSKVSEDTKFSIEYLTNQEKTPFVWLDKDLSQMDAKQQQNYATDFIQSLAGQTLGTTDGDNVVILKEFVNIKNPKKNKLTSDELYYGPTQYSNVKGIKTGELKNKILSNIDETILTSEFYKWKPDVNNRHNDLSIDAFDTRKTLVYDGKNMYEIKLDVAIMNDGTKAVYDIKRIAKKNSNLQFLPQKKNSTYKMVISQPSSLGITSSVGDNIPQTPNNVKSNTAPLIKAAKKNAKLSISDKNEIIKFTDKSLDNKNVAFDNLSKPIELGTIKTKNGETLKLSSQEYNWGNGFIRKITAEKENGKKAILSFEQLGTNTDEFDYKNDEYIKKYHTYNIIHLEGAERGDNTGTTLLNELIKEAKENGIKKIVAFDTRHNLDGRPSKGYWEKQGFVSNGEGDHVLVLSKQNKIPLNKQLENQASKIVTEDIETRNAMLENFKSYLEENDITNPTQQDIDNSLVDLLGYDNDMTPSETAKYEKLYNEVAKEYIDKQSTKYSISETPTKDSKGRLLTKKQQEYFKNSKVRDSEGHLLEVYHNSDDYGFTIFDKSDSAYKGYKSHYFTSNKDMASSYSENPNNQYKVYLNIENPMIVDAKDANWNQIGYKLNNKKNEDFEKICHYISTITPTEVAELIKENSATEVIEIYFEDKIKGTEYKTLLKAANRLDEKVKNNEVIIEELIESLDYVWYSTREIVDVAYKKGYDGVIIQNVYDSSVYKHPGIPLNPKGDLYIVFDSNQIKNVDNTKPTKNPDIRYSISVSKANTGVDNQGRKVSKGMQNYMKDSKARVGENINNSLVTVYHTMTDTGVQFNEFNPVGTPYYRFGDQIVNFYTNSKTMSSSYANYKERKADTKKLKSIEEARSWINKQNTILSEYDIKDLGKDGYHLTENGLGKRYFRDETDLLKNLKQTFYEYNKQFGSSKGLGKYQYEGYLNITNPYIVDGKGANWDDIVTSYDEISIRYAKEMKEEYKQQLSELYETSKWEYNAVLSRLKKLYKEETDAQFSGDRPKAAKIREEINSIVDGEPVTEDSYFNEHVTKLQEKINNEYNVYYSPQELYRMAMGNFEENALKDLFSFKDTTNGIIKGVLEKNKNGANYDGVIIKNILDYGSTMEFDDLGAAQDVYVTFNSNQFKSIDNTKPTDDPDWRYSITDSNVPITRTPGDIYGSDIKLQQDASIIRKVQRGQTLNPNEISKLTPEDANTTPILPKVDRNKVGDGDSKFASNIKNKTKMLSEEHRELLANEEEIAYYDKVTNEDSLNEAFKRLENGSFETTKWFSKASENATAVDVAEGWILLKQYADNNDTDGMVEVAKKLRDMGTKAGQTVQAFNIMSRLTPEGMVKYAQSELMEAYDKMVKGQTQKWIDENKNNFDLQPDEVKFIMDTMKEVSMMEDGYDKRVKLAQIQKLMTDKLPPAKGAGIKSWMRISMLFNPKTQVRNVAGNAIIAPVNYFGDMFASAIDKQIAKKTGVRTTGRTNIGKYKEGFKEGLYQSYNDFKLGINTRNLEGNRFEIGEGRSFNDNTKLGKALNKVDSILSFMLDAGDRGFYEAAFTNSINNQMVLNNTNEVTQEMIDIATQEALSRTWQDNNGYTKFVLNVRKGLNQINVRGYGLGDILIPFAKTPANLTKAIVDYSPVGLVTTMLDGVKLKNAIQTGQFTPQMQHKFVQELGKATAGTMLYVLGVALAKAGITSGESDEDKDVSNFLKNTLGISSYSIKIGDKTFTYDWAQPIAAPLTITSNIVNAKDNKEMALLEAVVGSMDSAGSTLLEQSFLQSINDVLNNYDGVVSGLITEVLELPSRAIPTLSKQIVDLTDNTQRQTFEKGQPVQSAINAAKAKIPGLSQKLAPQVDTLGRKIQRYGGKNNAFNVFFNPANVNTENISEAAQEIYDVYTATGDKTVMPRVVDYTYKNKDGVTIPLTTHQRAKLQKETGRVVEENVLELMDNEIYQNLSDVDKAAMLTDIVNYSYNIAKHEVLDTEVSQTYSGAYTYSKIGDISNYYLFKLPEFSADIDKDGNSISGSKKKKVVNYINSLPNLNKTEKAILVLFSGSSLKGTIYEGYDTSIVNYVRSKNLTEEEYAQVFTKLGYKYKNGRVYKK